jgi:hypothetical protein
MPRKIVAGYVYLIRLSEYVKIGHSRNPAKRLLFLSGLPWPATLLHSFISAQANVVEKALHRRFHASRVRGEWFHLTSAEIELIQTVVMADSPDDLPAVLAPPPQKHSRSRTEANLNVWVRSNIATQLRSYLAAHPGETKKELVTGALEEFLRVRCGVVLPSDPLAPTPAPAVP